MAAVNVACTLLDTLFADLLALERCTDADYDRATDAIASGAKTEAELMLEWAPMGLEIGTVVKIKNLKSRPELNGCEATVIDFRIANRRYGLQLSGGEGEKITVKPDNIQEVGGVDDVSAFRLGKPSVDCVSAAPSAAAEPAPAQTSGSALNLTLRAAGYSSADSSSRRTSCSPYSSVPLSFLCPMSSEIMRDPVTCADGHSYERTEIERWLSTHSTMTFEERALAHGSFKTVYRGMLRGHSEPIAVLRMKAGGSCEEEAATLVKLGGHPSLVRYLGVCNEGPDQLVLTELAPHGSLDQFLEAREDEVTMAHKLKMLEQICAGMVALSGAGMVHRDLAARNILVFAFDAHDPAATVVKITDFGLVQGEAVPFRWMPPEALQRRRFSEKSDVWAFGVTAWELLTGGQIPFAFIAFTEAVAERVCGGERLKRPGECPDALWALMLRIQSQVNWGRCEVAALTG
eukprot:jgi/Chrpa1/22813/Chrysochromulina_OHIO_Genome00009326-RA